MISNQAVRLATLATERQILFWGILGRAVVRRGAAGAPPAGAYDVAGDGYLEPSHWRHLYLAAHAASVRRRTTGTRAARRGDDPEPRSQGLGRRPGGGLRPGDRERVPSPAGRFRGAHGASLTMTSTGVTTWPSGSVCRGTSRGRRSSRLPSTMRLTRLAQILVPEPKESAKCVCLVSRLREQPGFHFDVRPDSRTACEPIPKCPQILSMRKAGGICRIKSIAVTSEKDEEVANRFPLKEHSSPFPECLYCVIGRRLMHRSSLERHLRKCRIGGLRNSNPCDARRRGQRRRDSRRRGSHEPAWRRLMSASATWTTSRVAGRGPCLRPLPARRCRIRTVASTADSAQVVSAVTQAVEHVGRK